MLRSQLSARRLSGAVTSDAFALSGDDPYLPVDA